MKIRVGINKACMLGLYLLFLCHALDPFWPTIFLNKTFIHLLHIWISDKMISNRYNSDAS